MVDNLKDAELRESMAAIGLRLSVWLSCSNTWLAMDEVAGIDMVNLPQHLCRFKCPSCGEKHDSVIIWKRK